MKKSIYCQASFIENLDIRGKSFFLDFIEEGAVIYLDRKLDWEKVDLLSDDLAKVIAGEGGKVKFETGVTYKSFCDDYKRFDGNKPKVFSPLFLIGEGSDDETEKDVCEKLYKSYGLLGIVPEEFRTHIKQLSSNNGIEKNQGETGNWNELLRSGNSPRFYGNSIVIIDNYSLKDRKENLEKLLDLIIPRSLDIPFYISLFINDVPHGNTGGEVYTDISTCLRNIKKTRINVDIRFNMVKVEDPIKGYTKDNKPIPKRIFHARHIFSNYFQISSDGGFDLFDDRQKAKKLAQVVYRYPFIEADVSSVRNMENNLKKALEVISSAISSSSASTNTSRDPKHKYWGKDRNNRLFKLVSD